MKKNSLAVINRDGVNLYIHCYSVFLKKNLGFAPYHFACLHSTHSTPSSSLVVAASLRYFLIPIRSFRLFHSVLDLIAQNRLDVRLPIGYPKTAEVDAAVRNDAVAKRHPTVQRIEVPTTTAQNTKRAPIKTS